MRDMKEFHELYQTWEKTLDKLIEGAPLGALPLVNALVDTILKKTLYAAKDLPEEMFNVLEYSLITSIICRWYALDPEDLARAMASEESGKIVKKCELFIAKMREEYDHGEA